MSRYNLSFGKSSENEAVKYLREQGYKILATNYKSRLGEIDIVAKEGRVVCFVEVKSRSSLAFGFPQEAVTKLKQHKISQSAIVYLKEKRWLEQSCRFDVLSIIRDEQAQARFELLKDAFDLDGNYTY